MCPTDGWCFSLQRMPNISTFAVQHIRTYFRHHIVEEGMELVLKESIRINLAMEDRKKEEDAEIRERTVVDARATRSRQHS